MQYLFVFGSTPTLSIIELKNVLKIKAEKILTPEIFQVDTNIPLDTHFLINRLGGTVKIALVEKIISEKDDLIKNISEVLLDKNPEKITFGISYYGDNFSGKTKQLNKQIKDSLGEKGRKVRFILPLGNSLSSVQITKEKITEIILVKTEKIIIIAKTIVVQDFEDWGKRDYQRPYADPKSGMLPPKIARMMLNIVEENPKDKIILDPFCGVGTIGAEGLMLGSWVILSDKDDSTSKKAEKNMEWLCKIYNLPKENFKVYCSDATNIAKVLPIKSVDAIVTEPYLGPPIETRGGYPSIKDKKLSLNKLENIITGLEKLYKGSLKEFKNVLKPNGKLAIIFPLFTVQGRYYPIKNIIDTCEKLGYNIIEGPIEYSRPQAVVKRHIYFLKLNSQD